MGFSLVVKRITFRLFCGAMIYIYIYYILYIIYYILYIIYYILYIIYYILYIVYYILYIVYYILYIVYYILYIIYCILYIIYYILYIIYYILYIIYFIYTPNKGLSFSCPEIPDKQVRLDFRVEAQKQRLSDAAVGGFGTAMSFCACRRF